MMSVRKAATAAFLCLSCLPATLFAFDFSDVEKKAVELAQQAFTPPSPVPKDIQELSYDQHRNIRFRKDKTLWRSKHKGFDVQMLHTGGVFNYGVNINIVDSEGVHPYPYRGSDFEFPRILLKKKLDEDLGFAGFRIRHPLNKPDVQDEVIVFAGASYFRAVSKGTLYGLSARGLAIDTALPSGEEFPIFREFWLERPSRASESVRVFALLDSKSIAGAYEFIIYPGITTRVRVKASLFPRQDIKEPGIAPLTSMFYLGENMPRGAQEWRPEVHDSDGLWLENGNEEQLLRPLVNDQQLRLSIFALENPKGFGLLQRDRAFRSYEDLETHQEKRPSAWVTPIGSWGKGHVKLTEIPTDNEYNDNIVAYWVPKTPFKAGAKYTFNYWLNWNERGPEEAGLAVVESTRTALLSKEKAPRRQFIVDFSGEPLATLLKNWDKHQESIKTTITTDDHSKLVEFHLSKNPEIGGVRLSFVIEKLDDQRTNLRAHLWKDGTPLTETWTYLQEQ